MEYRLPSFLNNKAAFETHGLHVTEIKNQAPGLPSYNRCTTYYHPVNQCYACTNSYRCKKHVTYVRLRKQAHTESLVKTNNKKGCIKIVNRFLFSIKILIFNSVKVLLAA